MIKDSAKVPSATLSGNFDPHVQAGTLRSKFPCRLASDTFAESLIVRAPAKINLALDVLKKDSSGYHKIRTVFQEISELYNEIEIKESSNASDHPAVQLLQKECGIDKSVGIRIQRNIPISSGLGGESSNHAAILKALNKLWKLNLSQQKLLNLAVQLGMDVPFFIIGGTSLGTHFGEKITPLKPLKLKFKIVPKSSEVKEKTLVAYSKLDLKKCGKKTAQTNALIAAIEKNDYPTIIKTLHNDFETLSSVPEGYHLSGTGPSIFQRFLRIEAVRMRLKPNFTRKALLKTPTSP